MPTVFGNIPVDEYIPENALTHTSTKEPSGFIDRTASTIALVDAGASYTFTIAPTGASFVVWIGGQEQIKTTESLTIAKTTGSTFVYYDAAGVLTQSTTPWSLATHTPIALIYYSATTGAAIMCEERHGARMDSDTHYHLHTTRGAQRGSGLTLGDYVAASGSPTNAMNRWSMSSGSVEDEDLHHVLSGLAAGGPYCVMRRTGATEWTWTFENDPFIVSGADIAYNLLTAGSWGQAPVSNNWFVNYWVFAWGTAATNTQVVVVQGQNQYGSLAAAQAARIESNLDLALYPFIECVARYQVVMKRAGYSTTGRARIESVTEITGNAILTANQTAATNHASLSNRSLSDQHPASSVTNTPAGSIAATDVQGALNELDTEKAALAGAAFTGDVSTTGKLAAARNSNSAASTEYIVDVSGTFSGTGDGPQALSFHPTFSPSGNLTVAYGGLFAPSFAPPAGVNIPSAFGLFMRVGTGFDATPGTVNSAYALQVAAPYLGTLRPSVIVGTNVENQGAAGVGTAIGAWIRGQSGATANFGLVVEASADNTLWVNSTTDSLTPTGGIVFGLSRDTNLYRAGINLLKTDDSLDIGARVGIGAPSGSNQSLNVGGSLADSNTFGIYMGNQVHAPTAAGSAFFQYAGGGIVDTGTVTDVLRAIGFYAAPITKTGGGTIGNTYGLLVDPSTSGTNNFGIRVGAGQFPFVLDGGSTFTCWITTNSDPTTQAGGIVFGASADTNLYRSAANTLKTDDSLVVGGTLTVVCNTTAAAMVGISGTMSTAVDGPRALSFTPTFAPTGNLTVAYGGMCAPQFAPTSGVDVGEGRVLSLRAETGSAGGTVGLVMGLDVQAPTYGGTKPGSVVGVQVGNQGIGGVAAAVGMAVAGQTGATATYGVLVYTGSQYTASFGAGSVRTLWVSNDADSTAAAGGIAFGLSADTNLYRSAANTLKTDDSLVVASNLTVNGYVYNLAGRGYYISGGADATAQALVFTNGSDSQGMFYCRINGQMYWGPGGSTSPDTNLYRSAANTLKTDDTLVAAAGLGAGGVLILSGTGSPENAVTAPQGSLYLRTDGGAGTTFYVKESGAGNTGWIGK